MTALYPDWINSLATASIAADMRAAIVDGQVVAAGLVTLLEDVANASPAVTAPELSDLRTIAANLNNGVAASSALTFVFNAVVNHDPHNTWWTGGGAVSIALGDLAVGSTSDQLQKLTSKWLQGGDLPSYIAFLPDQAGNLKTMKVALPYMAVNDHPVFGPLGPVVTDVNQGHIGDCYLMADLAELALQNPAAIRDMITDLGGGVYAIRFYENGVAQYETVNTQLYNGGWTFNHGDNIWASLIEKAYTQFKAEGQTPNSYTTIGNGGDEVDAMASLTGISQYEEFGSDKKSGWSETNYNEAKANYSNQTRVSSAAVLAEVVTALNTGKSVLVDSWATTFDAAGKIQLANAHVFAVYGYDSATQELELRNPWGIGKSFDTTFETSLDTLRLYYDAINVTDAVWTGALSLSATFLQQFADALNGDTTVKSITLTDSACPTLQLTASEAANDTTLLSKITNAAYEIVTPSSDTTYIDAANYSLSIATTGASLIAKGASDSVNLNGATETANLWGASENVWLKSDSDTANLEAAWQSANAYGRYDSVVAVGDHASIGLNGAKDTATLSGAYDNVWLNRGSETATLNGDHESATLSGGAGVAALWGANDSAALYGRNETVKIHGANDTVYLMSLKGADNIKKFNSTSTLDVASSIFADWNVFLSHATQSGANTVVSLDPGDKLTLLGVKLASLAAQTHFV